ncbi:1947_t:CDS:1 [Acaulospora morrowiae]|uniref:1947_t:CDS:1 n=1 Tax=Acaulospora morrowiae TaxID=94023 RepID=A0A9N9F8G7_9GLOM|nr:1947_t:CDS:1 [Acaulospora morrowiae]
MNPIYIRNSEYLEACFIHKLNLNELFDPNITAEELIKPLPDEIKKRPRSMNSFMCFRRKVYLLAVSGGFTEDIKDGRFLTQVVAKIWNHTSKEVKNIYTRLAREVKSIDNDRYKDVKVEKKRICEKQFVNTYMVSYGLPISRRGKNSISLRPRKSSGRPTNPPVEERIDYSIPSFVENSTTITANPIPEFMFYNEAHSYFILPVYEQSPCYNPTEWLFNENMDYQ